MQKHSKFLSFSIMTDQVNQELCKPHQHNSWTQNDNQL